MRRNLIETVMGAVVLLVAGLFLWVAYTTAHVRAPAGYAVTAIFGRAGGITVGSDVRISGIKIGAVTDRHLDTKSFDALVTMTIAQDVALPEDTIASIASEGPLGGRYVRLEPGNAATPIPAGGRIRETRGFRSLEDQVGEIIFLATGKRDEPNR
ncbi:MAG: outer membrane lipid asymmetry maintenance protein MlaD [Rhodospirillales bacterium]|nr:outer membrane lipid asymmetry maintenance protein MlaD [Rhodospirillales bacterium]